MLDNFKTFSSDEILTWLNDAREFLLNPRTVITRIKSRGPSAIQREFLFFFLIYSGSYLFLTIGTTVDAWVRPAVLNILTLFPSLVLFYLAARIFKTGYFFSTAAYFFGLHLLITPLAILFYATFLSTENYTYKYFVDCVTGIGAAYLFIMFGFAVESNKRLAIKISITSYLFANLVYFAFTRIDTDEYGVTRFSEADPIYQEYIDLVSPIENKEVWPTTRSFVVFRGKVQIQFGIQDVQMSNSSNSTMSEIRAYKTSIDKSLIHVEKVIPQLNFHRNKNIALVWKKYLEDVKEEINFSVADTTELSLIKSEMIDSITEAKMKVYIMRTDVNKLLNNHLPLKWYHNSIVKHHNNSQNIQEVSHYLIIFFVGNLLDVLVSDIILDEDAPRPIKERFIEIDE